MPARASLTFGFAPPLSAFLDQNAAVMFSIYEIALRLAGQAQLRERQERQAREDRGRDASSAA
jgi:hypothetical protein